jgi:putative membrane protein
MTETTGKGTDETSLKEAPLLWIKGFLMGSADIVPGVSGGTMALILGIYARLLNAIKSVNGPFLKALFTFKIKAAFQELHLKFLVFLFLGIFTALGFFTKVVPLQVYMFTHPEIVFGLFFGLIVGSIYILYKALEQKRWKEWGMLFLGIFVGLWIVSLVPADTPDHPAFVFLSGAIAICAMILPGISGSYLLLIMRKYDYLLSHIGMIGGVETMDGIVGLLPFFAGAIIGLAAFSRFLSWLLNRYHSQTLSLLIGFLIGSLFVIWPYQQREYVEQIREVEELPLDDELVLQLQREGVNENLPEYKRLGDVINPDATFDEFKRIEVETVKKKMLKSNPYMPDLQKAKKEGVNFWGGIAGILIGMVLVGGLDLLRNKSV